VRFLVVPHSVRPGAQIVEVLDDDGGLLATVTDAEDGRSVKVVSKWATGQVAWDHRGPNVAFDGRRIRAVVVVLGGTEMLVDHGPHQHPRPVSPQPDRHPSVDSCRVRGRPVRSMLDDPREGEIPEGFDPFGGFQGRRRP